MRNYTSPNYNPTEAYRNGFSDGCLQRGDCPYIEGTVDASDYEAGYHDALADQADYVAAACFDVPEGTFCTNLYDL